jgi:hypothetical protein
VSDALLCLSANLICTLRELSADRIPPTVAASALTAARVCQTDEPLIGSQSMIFITLYRLHAMTHLAIVLTHYRLAHPAAVRLMRRRREESADTTRRIEDDAYSNRSTRSIKYKTQVCEHDVSECCI